MRDVLRGLGGTPQGALFDLRERATLGRSAMSDVQLVDPEVSRFHAVIERDDTGARVITDLASKAGTYVDGERVQRAMLAHGALVEIAGFRLRYESVDDRIPATPTSKITGAHVISQTREVPRMPTGEVRRPSRPAIEPANEPVPPPRRPSQPSLTHEYGPMSANSAPTKRSTTSTFAAADASLLEVVRAVVEYRALRFDAATGRTHEAARADRVRSLQARLAVAAPEDVERPRRAHQRFPRTGAVLLGIVDGTETTVHRVKLSNIGAGGARINVEAMPNVDANCWLLIPTGGGARDGIAFPGRVAWTDSERGDAGLAFSGRAIEGPNVLPAPTARR